MIPRRPWAFSLVELLVVVAIIALLATLATTAFTSSGNARALAKSAADLAGTLELARSHAMAKNTSVFVGLQSTNQDKLLVRVYSKRPDEDEQPLQRPRTFENTSFTTDPANITNFRFNSRGELQHTNSTPLQSLDIKLGAASGASNNATVTILGLTGAVSVSQP
jgi:type II secretion system protein H